jgi:hypothetical protein
VGHNIIAALLTRSKCERAFRSAAYQMGLMMICCGVLGVSLRKVKALTVKKETVALIGECG